LKSNFFPQEYTW